MASHSKALERVESADKVQRGDIVLYVYTGRLSQNPLDWHLTPAKVIGTTSDGLVWFTSGGPDESLDPTSDEVYLYHKKGARD